MLARVINNEGAFLLALGRWEDAARSFEQAAQTHLETGNLGDAATSLLNWVELLLDRGEMDEARGQLQQTAELLGALPDPPARTAPPLRRPTGAGSDRPRPRRDEP